MTELMTQSVGEVVPDGLRMMMRGFPTGVSVVTALDAAGVPRGMTCSSLCSVSLDPPTLLVCLRAGSPTLEAVQATGSFAVNLLRESAQDAAELFASGDPERFDKINWWLDRAAAGPYLVDAAHAVADCRTIATHPVGDHVVVFGAATRVRHLTDCRPLMHGFRQYGRWLVAEPVI